MKKIPTVFKREFEGHKITAISPEFTSSEVKDAFINGTATIKFDGACCAILNGVMYKRFDAKPGRKIPEGAVPCGDPDPITGHNPHWVPVMFDNPADKWFIAAASNYCADHPEVIDINHTFEAIGPHFQGNPYNLEKDIIVPHGMKIAEVERTFEGVKRWLEDHNEEGLVFWIYGEPVCKIKRSDFGLPFPVREVTG